MQSYYDMTEQDKAIKALGEAMMDLAIVEKDHVKSNKMAYIGRELSLAGTPFAKRYQDFIAEEQAIVQEVVERLKLG